MNTLVQNMAGMGQMTDQVIANDMLISAKSGIKSYAAALSETSTPEVRQILRKQLDHAIMAHEQISNYMIQNGFYHPTQVKQQIQLDIQNAQTALSLG
ncbi:spore coat protein [Paenibacillus vulneris]|uniref:Spore coat protein n=1 Tax=Paenibacillus vulneris TaxID=1133364 RepID=A0ABW3UCQ1_9BACL|nr:spore coat protein [Paenibacillus sp. 32352]